MSCFMANLEFHIAWRYLFSKKGHNAINIVTGISSAAIIVVTAAMICVLSVMNGMGRFAQQMFTVLDPPLLVVPAEGQTLRTDTLPIASLYAREDIEVISRQIEQATVLRFENQQAPARVLGVDSLFTRTTQIDTLIYDGHFCVWDGAHERAVIGAELDATFHTNAFTSTRLHLYAPQRTKRINQVRKDHSLLEEKAHIAGAFSGDQNSEINQTVIVSIQLAQRLYEYDDYTATSLRVVPKEGVSVATLKQRLTRSLGQGYRVLDRYDQKAEYFRIFRIEKWLISLLLAFISLIAVINIVGSLSMLIIDKSKDSQILSNLGASDRTIRRIFLLEGWLISAIGTFVGLIIGVVICVCQQEFGWLKMGNGSNYILSAYPIQVQPTDILLVAFIVLGLGFLAAWWPSRKVKIEE